MKRTYSELSSIPDYIGRFNYLKLDGVTCDPTFGGKRYLNQLLYRSPEWKKARQKVLLRDNGCDLGLPGHDINSRIIIHHLNPITAEDILKRDPKVFDPENLVCVSFNTHNALHYSDENLLDKDPVTRKPNDTCPWR